MLSTGYIISQMAFEMVLARVLETQASRQAYRQQAMQLVPVTPPLTVQQMELVKVSFGLFSICILENQHHV